jgi:hypothetical protein
MENVGIFYDHVEYLTTICYNLWQFGIACASFGTFFINLVCLDQGKSGNPARLAQSCSPAGRSKDSLEFFFA